MTKSKIEWTDRVWNPVRGCSLVSKGCENCYAMRQAHRFSGEGMPFEGLTKSTNSGPKWTGSIMLLPDLLTQPMKWKKPSMVFVNSMSDLFHEDVPFDFIDAVFTVMADIDRHTYQILTKRPDRMLEFYHWKRSNFGGIDWRPSLNVWMGVSVESQEHIDRVRKLIRFPAHVKFISAEPLLGPLDLSGYFFHERIIRHVPIANRTLLIDLIDWVIVGGESGHNSRPMHPDWVRSLRDQCHKAGVPFFFKQWGEWCELIYTDRAGKYLNLCPEKGKVLLKHDDPTKWVNMERVGKSKSGNFLDGKQHLDFPMRVYIDWGKEEQNG